MVITDNVIYIVPTLVIIILIFIMADCYTYIVKTPFAIYTNIIYVTHRRDLLIVE